jgi:hypothetical protein
MPAAIFLTCLALAEKFSFLNGHKQKRTIFNGGGFRFCLGSVLERLFDCDVTV